MIQVEFPELEIETTIVRLLHEFHIGKIPLPLEVELSLPGGEAEGYRAAALRILREAHEKRMKDSEIILQ